MGLGAGLIWWALLAAPDGAEVDAAAERVLAAGKYQTDLPVGREPEPVPRVREPRPERRSDPEPVDGDALRPVGSALLWIFAGAFGIAVALWLAREMQQRRRARAAIAPPPEAAPRPAAAPVPRLPDHEALAVAGRFADAIHAILIAVLAAMGRAHVVLKPAWTSREILALVKLEDTAHRALRSLVGLVEVTRFGGAPAREEEYRTALGWLGSIGRGGPA